jgi:peptidoglycan/xylan/chitin deacetylase (PgdA/CDA1 family)
MCGTEKLRRTARKVKNLFVPRVLVLLYHRIAELPSDPQLLCVSRQHFAQHLEVLRKEGGGLQIRGLDQMLERGGWSHWAIGITFDDGYSDNLYHAKPLLEYYDVPATVFVTAGYVDSGKDFWHDDLERLLLQPGSLPERLSLDVNGVSYRWELGEAVQYGENTYHDCRGWNVLCADNPTRRHEIYRSLCKILLNLPDQTRRSVVDRLIEWAGLEGKSRLSHRVLSSAETIRLADGGLIEVGSHTMTHPVLAALPRAAQVEEISDSKARLENILGRSVASFAYPYGTRNDYTDETIATVHAAGFKYACSNFAGTIDRRTDPWQLPRFLVRDWDGEEFARKVHGWLNA